MSFRKEIKSTINNSNIFNLRNWIFQNGGYELYPDRTVNSVYFDNKENLMYFQSIEGLVPRKKIRIRNYNDINILDQIDKIDHLEYKISSVEGRYKYKKKFDNKKILKSGLIDKDYGACYPVINVTYKRSYFKIKEVRLTIDTKIKYKKVNFQKISNFTIRDNLSVVELKYQNSNNDNFVIKNFPFQFNRFSKYCRGFEFTNKINCDESL